MLYSFDDVYGEDSECGVTAHLLVDSFILWLNEDFKSHKANFLFTEKDVIKAVKRVRYFKYRKLLQNEFSSANSAETKKPPNGNIFEFLVWRTEFNSISEPNESKDSQYYKTIQHLPSMWSLNCEFKPPLAPGRRGRSHEALPHHKQLAGDPSDFPEARFIKGVVNFDRLVNSDWRNCADPTKSDIN